MTLSRFFRFQILFIFFVVFPLVGCSGTSWNKPDWLKPDLSILKPAGAPAKAVAVWEPAVKHEADSVPQRGFGGRVYFYDQESKKPIKIKGNVVVYAFDEENRKPDDNAPTRSYLFDKNDVKKLYSKSKLGPSYNFWIPWDAEGPDGKAQKVSLIVRYIPEVGSSVVSSQAAVYLPGKRNQTEFMAKTNNENRKTQEAPKEGTIQQVAHWNPNDPKPNQFPPPSHPTEHLVESNNNRPPTIKISTIR
ncbi:MAG: hypothetical protein LBP87_01120 [Planctomycetaceae bacterium]|jgi:hypothetical protein|nr:hypothetical protein [Planctomycetaceae bacterium]